MNIPPCHADEPSLQVRGQNVPPTNRDIQPCRIDHSALKISYRCVSLTSGLIFYGPWSKKGDQLKTHPPNVEKSALICMGAPTVCCSQKNFMQEMWHLVPAGVRILEAFSCVWTLRKSLCTKVLIHAQSSASK